MLILGGVVVVVVALVLVLSSGGGGKSSSRGSASTQGGAKTSSSTTSATHTAGKQTSSHHSESSVAVASPAALTVTVLNGTNTNGLAHSLADDLQQSGYLRATALNGSPPGSHTTTTVEYTSGHRAEAQAVGKALEVTRLQPMETGVSSLAGAATVVVIAGEDKAASVP
jgi:LytR cell envelope-related transcriptional attenuator